MLALIGGLMTNTATAQIDQSYNNETVVHERDHHNASAKVHHRKEKKALKKAQKRKIKAMKKVAKADGVVTEAERAVIKRERSKMKRKNRSRLIDRQAPVRQN